MAWGSRFATLALMKSEARSSADPPRCALCGDVIGVYEPCVLVAGGEVRIGSRASCQQLPSDAVLYHEACHTGESPGL
jgi:hypothetical protein